MSLFEMLDGDLLVGRIFRDRKYKKYNSSQFLAGGGNAQGLSYIVKEDQK